MLPKSVCIVGVGYVGLPLLEATAKSVIGFDVVGFDIDEEKISSLQRSNSLENVNFVSDPDSELLRNRDIYVVAVPTPVDELKNPDLSCLVEAVGTVARVMKDNSFVSIESTVYPGVTRHVLAPILSASGKPYRLGYSPERINPGDSEHTIDKITKVVSGDTLETAVALSWFYGQVAGDTYIAKSIEVAEAAKVIENVQRDLNIALVNELSVIFGRMGINTGDVLEAAKTKWNFHLYRPGMVGGHCIPVDPYYLVQAAKMLNYHPQVILAGRGVNDGMPEHIASLTVQALSKRNVPLRATGVLIYGLTFKENVADTRESPVRKLVAELKKYSIAVYGMDPLLSEEEILSFGVEFVRDFDSLAENFDSKIGCFIVAAAHDRLLSELNLAKLKIIMQPEPIVVDTRNFFSPPHFRSPYALPERYGFRRITL